MKKVVFSHNMPLDDFSELLNGLTLVYPEKPLAMMTTDEAKAAIRDADVFLCIADYACDRALMALGEKLSIVGTMSSGFNNIDVDYATSRGILVLNTPNAVIEPTSEMTIALMLTICRSTARYDRDLRKERFCTRPLLFERDMMVYGKTLGIVGLGRIGKSVAQKARGLGMRIAYYDPFRLSEEQEQALHVCYMPLEELLRTADVLTLHVPYLPENHHFMNEERLHMMKETAYVINASRGPIVSEAALVQALTQGWIRGAALDVHEFEPKISQQIAELPNIVITPHCGTNIAQVRLNMLRELLEGIHALNNGDTPPNIVNRRLLDKK